MLSGLEVKPDAMARNLKLTNGLICTEAVMMALAPKVGRGTAHDALSQVCCAVANGDGSLIDLLTRNPDIARLFDRPRLEKLIDPTNYLGLSGTMADQVLAAVKPREGTGAALPS